MDFIDQIKQFAKRVENLRENIQTEEATKTSIILPFLQLMGFDIFNPNEVVPEYTADVGIKRQKSGLCNFNRRRTRYSY